MLPLDGQQRLTTLWLLHWFVALKAGKLEEARKGLANFTYEREFGIRNAIKKLNRQLEKVVGSFGNFVDI